MSYIILAILFLLAGFFMKFSDDLYDENHNVTFASIFGIFCGIASGLATVGYAGAAYVFIAIPIGNLIALKIDGLHHIITLLVFVIVCLICGIPDLNIIVLLFCILGALFDEIGHETISNVTDNLFLNLFFEYRFVMKIVLFALAICGEIDVVIFICFMLFEVAYTFAGMIFEKLN